MPTESDKERCTFTETGEAGPELECQHCGARSPIRTNPDQTLRDECPKCGAKSHMVLVDERNKENSCDHHHRQDSGTGEDEARFDAQDDIGLWFTEEEKLAIADLSERLDLRPAKVIKQALRVYQLQTLGEPRLSKAAAATPQSSTDLTEKARAVALMVSTITTRAIGVLAETEWLDKATDIIASALARERESLTADNARLVAEKEQLQDNLNWVERKIRTVYQSPATDREQLQNIQGSMHVICAGFDTWERFVKIGGTTDVTQLKGRIAELEQQLAFLHST